MATGRLAHVRNGYTLVEMSLVLVVIAILSGIAVAKLAPGLESSRIRRAATIIAADFRYAQAMAARQHAPVVVIIQPAIQTYIIRDRGSATVFRQRSLLDLRSGPKASVVRVAYATGSLPNRALTICANSSTRTFVSESSDLKA